MEMVNRRRSDVAVRVQHRDPVKLQRIQQLTEDLQRKAVASAHMTILTGERQIRQLKQALTDRVVVTHRLHQLRQLHKVIHGAHRRRPDTHVHDIRRGRHGETGIDGAIRELAADNRNFLVIQK